MFPCDSAAAYDLFTQFNNSYVDIAIGNRVNRPGYYMGGGILYRANERTKVFWKRVYELMVEKNNPDDQFGIQSIMMGYHNNYPFNYRVLSFNWLFASHGIDEKGCFSGPGRCYRSSVPVTGKVRFVHGNPIQCKWMNGENGEFEKLTRVLFLSDTCKTTGRDLHIATSELALQRLTYPYPACSIDWDETRFYSREGIFW